MAKGKANDSVELPAIPLKLKFLQEIEHFDDFRRHLEIGTGDASPRADQQREWKAKTMVNGSAYVEVREKSDSTLVAATRGGQTEAFGLLVKRHEASAFRVAFRITRNREDAQDCAQQGFCKALMNLDRFQGMSCFSTWLTRIVINESLLCLRRRRVWKEVPLEGANPESETTFEIEVPDIAENPAELFERQEKEGLLHKAINKLSPEFKAVLKLRLEERTTQESADTLGLRVGTLKARLFRARQQLRQLVGDGRFVLKSKSRVRVSETVYEAPSKRRSSVTFRLP